MMGDLPQKVDSPLNTEGARQRLDRGAVGAARGTIRRGAHDEQSSPRVRFQNFLQEEESQMMVLAPDERRSHQQPRSLGRNRQFPPQRGAERRAIGSRVKEIGIDGIRHVLNQRALPQEKSLGDTQAGRRRHHDRV